METLLIHFEEGSLGRRKGSCKGKKVGRHKLPLGLAPVGGVCGKCQWEINWGQTPDAWNSFS